MKQRFLPLVAPFLASAAVLSLAAGCGDDTEGTGGAGGSGGQGGATTTTSSTTTTTSTTTTSTGQGGQGGEGGAAPIVEPPHEVWLVDQSNTVADGGGSIHIYDGKLLSSGRAVTPEVINLGDQVRSLCLTNTGTAPVRPHMLFFNSDQSRAILSFVATGHVVFFDAATRAPVECIDAGLQAHAAVPTPDDTAVIVANQNGKLLQRIDADFVTDTYVLDAAATIDLATGQTPSGADIQDATLRPDNAPICPVVSSDGGLVFVTLRGGGLLVVDPTSTPLAIIAEYDRSVIAANGCGGIEFGGKLYINAGGGTTATPYENKVYAFDLLDFAGTAPFTPNTPTATLVVDRTGQVDSHGAALVGDGAYAWFADRADNSIAVVDTATNADLGDFSVTGTISADPAPDLLDTSPAGTVVYAALRGLKPLTANNPNVNNAVGDSPGIGVIRVLQGGQSGQLERVELVSNLDSNGDEIADPHGIRVRLLPSP